MTTQDTLFEGLLPKPFRSEDFRRALGLFPTGVAVVTSVTENGAHFGVTANSFASVSLEPPLVLWSVRLAAVLYKAYRDSGRFAVNILAADQKALSRQFASPIADRFAGVEYTLGLGGVPLIGGCAAVLECRHHQLVMAGDHAIIIGEVLQLAYSNRVPLLYVQGQYAMPRSRIG